MVNAWGGDGGTEKKLGREDGGAGVGAYLVVGLAAGLAAGTKLNFLLPAAVLVIGLALVAPRGGRGRASGAAALAALAGGGYWYLRNLVHSGNPLPWIHHLGPIDLPAPEQALGGREAHSVLGYLGDGNVWSDWFLPGLHSGLWFLWPLLALAAVVGLVLRRRPGAGRFCVPGGQKSAPGRRGAGDRGARRARDGAGVAGRADVGLGAGGDAARVRVRPPLPRPGPRPRPRAAADGARGRLITPPIRECSGHLFRIAEQMTGAPRGGCGWKWPSLVVAGLLVAIAVGYPVQRHYLQSRYKDPTFTSAPGLNAAFAWARDVSGARIATTSTRQYPLFGTDLSNRVQYLGIEQPHGGFEAVEDLSHLSPFPQRRRLRLRGRNARPHEGRQAGLPAASQVDRRARSQSRAPGGAHGGLCVEGPA